MLVSYLDRDERETRAKEIDEAAKLQTFLLDQEVYQEVWGKETREEDDPEYVVPSTPEEAEAMLREFQAMMSA